MRYISVLRLAPLLLVLSGCLLSSEPRALEVTVSIDDPTPTVLQEVTFTVEAAGAGVTTLHIQYGDTGEETFFAGGANTVKATFPHQYEGAGTFTVVATARDTRTTRTATIVVTVAE